jgi:hypothetical protein
VWLEEEVREGHAVPASTLPPEEVYGAGARLPPAPQLSIRPPAWLWQAAASCKFRAYI